MILAAAAVFAAALVLFAAAGLVWWGRVQPFPSSVRCNHAGVLGSAGLFAAVSASLILLVGGDAPAPGRVLAGGVWLFVFLVFMWMFLETPNQWASRMARAAEHQFDSRWERRRLSGPRRP